MKYEGILGQFFNSPWVIAAEVIANYEGILRSKLFEGVSREERRSRASEKTYGLESVSPAPKGIAIIAIHGPILNRLSHDSQERSGGTSPQHISQIIRSAADAPEIAEIILDVDSPGGQALNIDELAATVRHAASKKRTTAVANGMMTSGAYWVASQASEVVATRGSVIGSIGVITSHTDLSSYYANSGVDVQVYRTGSRKALGQDVDPNSDSFRADIMKDLEAILELFAIDVATGRRMDVYEVLSRFALDSDDPRALKGGTVLGSRAVELGLADRVATFSEVLDEATQRVIKSNGRGEPTFGKVARAQVRVSPVGLGVIDSSFKEAPAPMIELFETLGVTQEATVEQAIEALNLRLNLAKEEAAATANARVSKILGINVTDDALKQLKQKASDGEQYRNDLLNRLHALSIAMYGNDAKSISAADRSKKLYSGADIDDIRAEVERLGELLNQSIPNQRLSQDLSTAMPSFVDYDAV